MKVHKEGTGLLLTLFTIFFVVDVALYQTVGRGWVFYTTTFVTTVLFLLVLNFFRSPFRRFPFDSEGLVIASRRRYDRCHRGSDGERDPS